MMAAPDLGTIILSLLGGAVAGTLPKLIDVFFGAKIAERKGADERADAFRMRVFDEAAEASKERAADNAALRDRLKAMEVEKRELEAELRRQKLEDTGAYTARKRQESEEKSL